MFGLGSWLISHLVRGGGHQFAIILYVNTKSHEKTCKFQLALNYNVQSVYICLTALLKISRNN